MQGVRLCFKQFMLYNINKLGYAVSVMYATCNWTGIANWQVRRRDVPIICGVWHWRVWQLREPKESCRMDVHSRYEPFGVLSCDVDDKYRISIPWIPSQ